MPNRIIKESICVSDSIDELSWFEEVLFYRLTVNCDDYGRFDGRIAVIKNRLFPLKDNLTVKTVRDGINKLASVGLVFLYESDGKPYLCLPTWNEHQNVRAKRSKYPEPVMDVNTSVCKCNQVQADVPDIQSVSLSVSLSESNASDTDTSVGNKPPRHKYGLYKNVLFTDEEYEKLQEEFPNDYSEWIERLSEYIASTGKKYRSHLATIRSWSRKDTTQKPSNPRRKVPGWGGGSKIGEAEKENIRRLMAEC